MASMVCRDVIVIGGGWSGIVACKYMLAEGLSVIVLEKRDSIGGVWSYSDDPEILTVMKCTTTTSSASLTEMSDFPMPDDMGEFPHHEQIYQYLNDYCDAFNVHPHIRLGCGVEKADKVGDNWEVTVQDGTKYLAKHLVMCTGVHQKPILEVKDTLFSEFSGDIMHSQILKSFIPEHKGKRILIFGGGETAADLVEEWHNGGAEQVIWCIPRGQHFFRKYAKILPHRPPQALDKASSRVMKIIAPYTKGKPGLAWVCHWTTAGSLLAYQGHGIPEWRNDAEFFHFFINKNGHVLDLVDYKHVVPKGAIDAVQGKTIFFSDGSQAEVDVVILCTGYEKQYPFLPPRYQVPLPENYKFIFNIEDPSLAFVGYVRPIVGSIPIISELQAWYTARVFSGAASLPENGDIENETNQDKEFWSNYFKDSSHRLDTLVEIYTYLDDIGGKAGLRMSYWEIFKTNPRDCIEALLAPGSASSYRLKIEKERPQALMNLKRRGKGCLGVMQLFLIMFCRLILFDWWLIKLGKIKFWFQTNYYCKKIKTWPVVKFLDWIWTTPKRLLFDTKTRP